MELRDGLKAPGMVYMGCLQVVHVFLHRVWHLWSIHKPMLHLDRATPGHKRSSLGTGLIPVSLTPAGTLAKGNFSSHIHHLLLLDPWWEF